jgi:hypothetical protein
LGNRLVREPSSQQAQYLHLAVAQASGPHAPRRRVPEVGCSSDMMPSGLSTA